MANSVDPDQMSYSVTCDLGLYCLLKLFIPILRVITETLQIRGYPDKFRWTKLTCPLTFTFKFHNDTSTVQFRHDLGCVCVVGGVGGGGNGKCGRSQYFETYPIHISVL